MSLDLTLLPFDHDETPTWAFSHSMLPVDVFVEAFSDALFKEEDSTGKLVPARFTTFYSRDEKYSEPHYGETQRTPYGEPLKFVLARDLVLCFDVTDDHTERNAAVLAYLKHLNPLTKIALYWR